MRNTALAVLLVLADVTGIRSDTGCWRHFDDAALGRQLTLIDSQRPSRSFAATPRRS